MGILQPPEPSLVLKPQNDGGNNEHGDKSHGIKPYSKNLKFRIVTNNLVNLQDYEMPKENQDTILA